MLNKKKQRKIKELLTNVKRNGPATTTTAHHHALFLPLSLYRDLRKTKKEMGD